MLGNLYTFLLIIHILNQIEEIILQPLKFANPNFDEDEEDDDEPDEPDEEDEDDDDNDGETRSIGQGPGEELYDDFRSLFETRPQIMPDYTSYSNNLPSTMHFMDHNDLHTIWTMGEDEYDPQFE